MAIGNSNVGLLFTIRAKNETKPAFNDTKKDIKDVSDTARKAGGGFDHLSQSAGRAGVSVGEIVKGGLVLDFLQRIASVALDAGRAVLEYSAKMEQTKIGFTSLLGNAGKAEKLLTDLKKLAKDTPFEFAGLAPLAQRLLGANVELSKTIPLLTDIGNIVAATGEASQERLDGVTVAISQMIAKQKVSAEEMEQLSERGINGFQLLSEATGKSQAELRKLAEQGAISSDVMVAALQKISREKWGDAMSKQGKTFSGALSSIKDELMQTAATAFQPLFKEITKLTVKFSQELQSKKGDYQAIGELIAKYIGIGLSKALVLVVESAGKYIGNRFGQIFKEKQFFDPITQSFYEGFWESLLARFGADDDFIRRFKIRMRYAFSFGLRSEKDIAKEYAKQQPISAPKVYDYSLPPNDPRTQTGQNEAKRLLEESIANSDKLRKEREAAYKKHLQDLERFNDAKLKVEQDAYERAQKYNEDNFEDRLISQEEFQKASIENLVRYATRARALLAEGFKLESAGKSGAELSTIKLQYNAAIESLNELLRENRKKIQEDITKQEKEEGDKRTQSAKEESDRKIALAQSFADTQIAILDEQLRKGLLLETAHAKRVGELQIEALESEKEQLLKLEQTADIKNQILLIEDKITRQKIKNREEEEKAVEVAKRHLEVARERAEVEGVRRSDTGAAAPEGNPNYPTETVQPDLFLGESVLTQIDEAGQRVTDFGGAWTALKDIAGQALQSMALGIGNLVQNLVLLGNSGGQSFRKLVASVLAGVSSQAAVLAVMELAYGIAALTPWGAAIYGNPAFHFKAAALFGSIAVATGLLGRAVAGDSFRQQTGAGAGNASASSGGQRNGTNLGAYSGNTETQILEAGRNTPSRQAIVKHELTLKIQSNDSHIVQAVKNNVKDDGDLRGLFINLATT